MELVGNQLETEKSRTLLIRQWLSEMCCHGGLQTVPAGSKGVGWVLDNRPVNSHWKHWAEVLPDTRAVGVGWQTAQHGPADMMSSMSISPWHHQRQRTGLGGPLVWPSKRFLTSLLANAFRQIPGNSPLKKEPILKVWSNFNFNLYLYLEYSPNTFKTSHWSLLLI